MRDFQLLSLHACKEVCGPAKACVQIWVTPAKNLPRFGCRRQRVFGPWKPQKRLQPSLSFQPMSFVRLLVCLLPLMFSAAEAVAAPEMDYASLRADVVKAYAQQAAEMTQSLTVLQALSTDTAVMLTRLESACAK